MFRQQAKREAGSRKCASDDEHIIRDHLNLYPRCCTRRSCGEYTDTMQRDHTNTVLALLAALIILGTGAYLYLFGKGKGTFSFGGLEGLMQPAAAAVPFEKLAHGSHSTISERSNYLIKSDKELQELWKLLDVESVPPTIDFSAKTVVAVFAGQGSNADIAVAAVEDSAKRVVSVAVTTLARPCPTSDGTAAPYEVVAVPATTLTFDHKDVVKSAVCPQ